jgi:L-seryl-tRNA(Ser) seleniumtransferase
MAVIDLAPGVTRGLVVPAALAPVDAMLADRLGTEAATVVHGFAGGILVAVAACLTGERPGAIDRLPDGGGRIVLQKAHCIDLGCRLTQILAAAGAVPVEIGAVNGTALYQLEEALAEGAAGALFVVGAGVDGGALLELPSFLFAAHSRQVPVVVVAPDRVDWTGLLDAGADLVVLDATTAFGGPGAGIVAGRTALVRAARLQRLGIGRLVQPTPALLAELAGALAVDRAALVENRRDRVAARFSGIAGIAVEPGDGGLVLVVDAALAGFSARDLAFALQGGEPAVLLDDRKASTGRLVLDLARPDDATLEQALLAIGACIEADVAPAPWPGRRLDGS